MYEKIMGEPSPSMLERIKRCYSNGPFAGIFMLVIIMVDIFVLKVLELLAPRGGIEAAVDVDCKAYRENKEKYGDHQFTVLEKK